jgi:hypothetical protein
MDTEKGKKAGSVSFFVLASLAITGIFSCFLLSSCGVTSKSLPTISNDVSWTPSFAPVIPTNTPVPTFLIPFTPTPNCISGLSFISDVTIPDFSIVAPGISLDKQWLVQNSGSCNWDNHYRVRLIAGDGLGASQEQALYPARSGTQATLRMIFTAPLMPGQYLSEWQAFDPQGIPFGDTFFIKIIVQ